MYVGTLRNKLENQAFFLIRSMNHFLLDSFRIDFWFGKGKRVNKPHNSVYGSDIFTLIFGVDFGLDCTQAGWVRPARNLAALLFIFSFWLFLGRWARQLAARRTGTVNLGLPAYTVKETLNYRHGNWSDCILVGRLLGTDNFSNDRDTEIDLIGYGKLCMHVSCGWSYCMCQTQIIPTSMRVSSEKLMFSGFDGITESACFRQPLRIPSDLTSYVFGWTFVFPSIFEAFFLYRALCSCMHTLCVDTQMYVVYIHTCQAVPFCCRDICASERGVLSN